MKVLLTLSMLLILVPLGFAQGGNTPVVGTVAAVASPARTIVAYMSGNGDGTPVVPGEGTLLDAVVDADGDSLRALRRDDSGVYWIDTLVRYVTPDGETAFEWLTPLPGTFMVNERLLVSDVLLSMLDPDFTPPGVDPAPDGFAWVKIPQPAWLAPGGKGSSYRLILV